MSQLREAILKRMGESFWEQYFPEINFNMVGQSTNNVLCPFHEESNPSLSVHKDKGFFCHSCGKKGDAISFFKLKNELKENTAIKRLYSRYIHPIPSETQNKQWHEALCNNKKAIKDLNDKRGISTKSITKYHIGWDSEDQAYTVPIKGPYGFNHDIRKIKIGLSSSMARYKNLPMDSKTAQDKKARGETTFSEGGRLFPYSNLSKRALILCEGEFDCILLNQHGFPAITTGGVNTWKKWYGELRGKDITILLDNDNPSESKSKKNPGQDAAEIIKSDLFTLCTSVNNVVLPIWGDVTDYLMGHNTPEDLQALIDEQKGQTTKAISKQVSKKMNEPEVELSSLADVDSNKHYGALIEVKAQIVGEKKKNYTIITKGRLKCTMDMGGKCETCPMNMHSGEVTIDIDPYTDPKFLAYVGMKDKDIITEMGEGVGAPKACAALTLHRDDVVSVQLMTAAPIMARTNTTQSEIAPAIYSMVRGLELNSEYSLQGYVRHNPKDQSNCFLVRDAVKLKSVDNLSFKDLGKGKMEDLKEKFGAKDSDVKAILKKHSKIMNIYSKNVTKIYGRKDLHTAAELTFHSPLQINFEGLVRNSYIETVIVGDTNTGKNAVVDAISDYLEAGLVVDAAATTYAGLVASTDKSGDFEWGLYVRQHRRLIGIDEGGHLSTTIEALRTIREGKADYAKAYAKRQTSCMARLIVMANDPKGYLSTNPYPVQAVPSLFKQEADISRFSLAFFMRREDTPTDLINQEAPPCVETDITQEDFQLRLANAWSLQPNDITITPGAIKYCSKKAKKMAYKYSETIPLVQAAVQKKKIASWGCALAASLFNMVDGKLVVTESHMKAACWLIEKHYDSDACQYGQFSENERERNTITDVDKMIRLVFTPEEADPNSDLKYTIKQLLMVRDIDAEYFSDCFMSYKTPAMAKDGMKILVRHNCLHREGKVYRKTEQFSKLLHNMLKEIQNPKKKERGEDAA